MITRKASFYGFSAGARLNTYIDIPANEFPVSIKFDLKSAYYKSNATTGNGVSTFYAENENASVSVPLFEVSVPAGQTARKNTEEAELPSSLAGSRIYLRNFINEGGGVNINEAIKVEVYTEYERHAILKSTSGPGTLEVRKGGTAGPDVDEASEGDVLFPVATPATGCKLQQLMFDGQPAENGTRKTMPTHDVSVSAVFVMELYNINFGKTGEGTVKVTRDGEETWFALYGDEINVTATPETGWYLQTLQFNGNAISSGQTVSMPAMNSSISATFRQTEHQISIESGTGGSVKALVNGEEASTAHYGDRITLEADADAGYILDSLTFNGAPVKAGQAYSMPNGNVTVKAAFRNIPYADIQMGIQDVFPAYMLRDRNGLAMASAIFTAMKKTVTDLGNAFRAMYDPDKMPEWRLDEAAQEMGMRWYDNTASVENKRDLIRNAWNFARIIGTPKAVEDVMSALFGKTVVEEEAEAFHYSLKTSYDTGSTAALRRFYRLLEGCANLRSTLDGIEFDGGAVVTEGAVYSAAMIHGEEIGSWAVAE